jgi:enoyl-CoA hydratase/carnithine racemase
MKYYTIEQVENIVNEKWAFIKCNIKNNVMTITLDRSEKKNALHPHMVNEITFALNYAHYNNSIWCVVLDANGDVFCSGADLKAFMGMVGEFESTIPQPKEPILLGEIFGQVHKPVICKLKENVMAGGLFFIAGSHYVLASDKATLGLPEVKRGLFPFQVMAALLNTMPKRKVINWCISGDIISSKTAKDWGLVSQICENSEIDEKALELIDKLKNNSPTAIRMGLEAYEKINHSKGEHQYLMEMLQKTIMSKDAKEGITAFKEKRNPVWTGE